jgi:hypothetical protein
MWIVEHCPRDSKFMQAQGPHTRKSKRQQPRLRLRLKDHLIHPLSTPPPQDILQLGPDVLLIVFTSTFLAHTPRQPHLRSFSVSRYPSSTLVDQPSPTIAISGTTHGVYHMAIVKQLARAKKNSKKTDQTPKQYFAGQTYACQACKNGHRVRTCNHGRTKPIAPTNQPGRPSSGSKRKCSCPKNCDCKYNCKCDKNCLCMQKMYLIVLVSQPDAKDTPRSNSPMPPVWDTEDGQKETLKPVWTDISGQMLSPAEVDRRKRETEEREQGRSIPGGCCSSKNTQDAPTTAPTTGCRHREAIKQEQSTPIPDPALLNPATASRCTCGTSCQCKLCPEHPNNAATKQYTAQTLDFMTSQNSYMPANSMMMGSMYTPDVPQESCMGGQPRFYLTRQQPTQQDFHTFFPGATNGDYVMSYPIDRTAWPMSPPQIMNSAMQNQYFDAPMQQQQQPVMPSLPPDNIQFDDSFLDVGIDWPPQGDSVWESRLGDASVDQISQFPPMSMPATNHLSAPNAFNQPLSPSGTQLNYDTNYDPFDQPFQPSSLPPLPMSSPESSFTVSAITSPPYQALNASLLDLTAHDHIGFTLAPTPATVSQPTPPAPSARRSCCGGSNDENTPGLLVNDFMPAMPPMSPMQSPVANG